MADVQLQIRFRGICSHIDLGGNGARKMRTVLIRGRHADGIEHHIPFLEFFLDDLDLASLPDGLSVIAFNREDTTAMLGRIELADDYEIRVNAQPGLVEQLPFFKDYVPSLSEVMGFHAKVKPGLLTVSAKDVDRSLVTTVFDLPKGRIQAGDGEDEISRFDPPVTYPERKFAKWTDLYVVVEGQPIVQLLSLRGRRDYTLKFKPITRMITIGNEPLKEITGLLPGGGDPAARAAGHWPMFYYLIDNAPDPAPAPVKKQLSGAGCPNNNLP